MAGALEVVGKGDIVGKVNAVKGVILRGFGLVWVDDVKIELPAGLLRVPAKAADGVEAVGAVRADKVKPWRGGIVGRKVA